MILICVHIHVVVGSCLATKVYIDKLLALYPGPLRRRRGVVHTVCACVKISVNLSVQHNGKLIQHVDPIIY